MKILKRALCHHPHRFYDHNYCDTGDITILILHLTSRKHMFKGLCEFMGGSSSW